MNRKQKKLLYRLIITAVVTTVLLIVPIPGELKRWLFAVPYLIIGYDILKKAAKGIVRGRLLDENFLMAVATVGAFAIGEYTESVAVMIFYQLGELFESYAVGKSRRSIGALMDIRPDHANIEEEGVLRQVDPQTLQIGSVIVVQPGEKIPIDGVVMEGTSMLDTKALTGESIPGTVSVGDEVISGCICLDGLLRIRTTKDFGESTVSKILELVENATSRKSRSENFISRFARYYTPIVCGSALVLAIVPPAFRYLCLGLDADWHTWIYNALSFLVTSCPCALVISIPLTFFAGIGGAGRQGILIKGSNYLETLSKVKTVVFDKTGTMTEGVFEVVGVHHNTLEERELLQLAALAESRSSHPIARSIVRAAEHPASEAIQLTDVREISGCGVVATTCTPDHTVAVGNARLMEQLGISYRDCHHVGTIVHVAIDGEYAGHIVIADVIKPHAADAIRELKAAGIRKTVMLTGDIARVAEQTAEQLNIDEVHSGLLPQDKVDMVEHYLAETARSSQGKLAFVGDGINDAPVLSRADIGIAMGALGSDAAIEAADVVIMDDDPLRIAAGIRISRKCLRIVNENIYIAIGIKLLCLILIPLGIVGMEAAIFADVGVMVLAVLNAIRALSAR